jgi:phage pi2 protein 07
MMTNRIFYGITSKGKMLIAYGSHGLLKISKDHGETWEIPLCNINPEAITWTKCVYNKHNDTHILLGNQGCIGIIDDLGLHVKTITDYPITFKDLLVLPETLITISNSGIVGYSKDEGKNWWFDKIGNYNLTSIIKNLNQIYITSDKEHIFYYNKEDGKFKTLI